jgi:hypothetical protein
LIIHYTLSHHPIALPLFQAILMFVLIVTLVLEGRESILKGEERSVMR